MHELRRSHSRWYLCLISGFLDSSRTFAQTLIDCCLWKQVLKKGLEWKRGVALNPGNAFTGSVSWRRRTNSVSFTFLFPKIKGLVCVMWYLRTPVPSQHVPLPLSSIPYPSEASCECMFSFPWVCLTQPRHLATVPLCCPRRSVILIILLPQPPECQDC